MDSYLDVFAYVISLERLYKAIVGVSIMYQGHIVWNTLRHEDMRLLLKFIRYHEMIGLRSSSKEFRLGSSGFLSNLRGEYVKPMVDPIDTTPEGETGSLNGKADGISLTHTSGASQNSPTPRLSSLFTPPLCIAPVRRQPLQKEKSLIPKIQATSTMCYAI